MLRRILAALDAHLALEVRWRAGALDRLLDMDHSALVSEVTRLLGLAGWELRVEVTYSERGERGSIDILAFSPASGTLLIIEVKTEVASVEETLRKIDEKVRLAPTVARQRFGWQSRAVGWLLVMPERSTLRRRVASRAALFDRAFPTRGGRIRRWLQTPAGAIAGLWFLSPSQGATGIRGGGGRERVRRPKRPSGSRSLAG